MGAEAAGARIEVFAPDGLPEIAAGADLAALVARALPLVDGDIVVLTSKVVSKAEGRVRAADEAGYLRALAEETDRVVAHRGPLRVVRHRLGLVLAAGGIDRSNVSAGSIVLLPLDPDRSASALRAALHERTGARVGVVITDTAGRAWREGQTDIAIGVAGLLPAESFTGRVDQHGNTLSVTAPAVADQIAGAAELVQGKLGGRPLALVRGLAELVLPLEEDGPGAAALVRPAAGDLFGYGAREAVLAALAGEDADRVGFGATATLEELSAGLARVLGAQVAVDTVGAAHELLLSEAHHIPVVEAVCFSHGWRVEEWHTDRDSAVRARVSPVTA